jgi:predicted house-cleaning noncanonical NTP pyrophosphatase (MazG superfamily)
LSSSMPDRIYYNKLVWDNVPDLIREKGKDCEVRTLSDDEFEVELLKKVEEEASALPETTSRQELIDEVADVVTCVEYIKSIKHITELELADALERHARRKGRFEKKTYLVWSSDSAYETNEKAKTVVRLSIPSKEESDAVAKKAALKSDEDEESTEETDKEKKK